MNLPVYTTAELGIQVCEELRELRFENAALKLAVRLALKALKRDEVNRAEMALREVSE